MKLYKATEDPVYMVWTGLAIALNARRTHWDEIRDLAGNGADIDFYRISPKGAKSLKLCAAMIEKVVPNGKVTHSEAVGCYLHMLRQSGRDLDALEALRGPCKEIRDVKNIGEKRESEDTAQSVKEPVKYLPIDYLKEEVDVLCSNAQWEEAWKKTCQLLIWHDNDDWSLFQTAIECCFQYLWEKENLGEDAFHAEELSIVDSLMLEEMCDTSSAELPKSIENLTPTVSTTRAVVTYIQKMVLSREGDAPSSRGPFLGEILLELRVLEHSAMSYSQVRDSSVSVGIVGDKLSTIVSAKDYENTCKISDPGMVGNELTSHLLAIIYRYLVLFGRKPCCFSDLSCYLRPFSVPEQAEMKVDTILGKSYNIPAVPEWILRPDFPKCSFISTSFAPLRFFKSTGDGKLGTFPNFARDASRNPEFPCAFDYTGFPGIQMTPEVRERFSSMLKTFTSSVDPESINSIQTYTTVQKILRHVNEISSGHLSPQELQDISRHFCEIWVAYTSKSTNTSDKTSDFRPADDLVLLATDLLEELAFCCYQNKEAVEDRVATTFILDCIRITELAYAASPNNFNLCRKLLHLYDLMGAVEPFGRNFECLGVKHIQWETMGYLLLSTTRRLGFRSYSALGAEQVCGVHREERRETAFYMKRAIEHNNYSSVLDLQKMQERMKMSLSRNDARCLRGYLSTPSSNISEVHEYLRSILLVGEYPELAPDIDIEHMETLALDNRDFTLYSHNWDPVAAKDLNRYYKLIQRKKTVLQIKQVTTLHYFIFWSLEKDAGASKSRRDTLKAVTEELLECCQTERNVFINAPLSFRRPIQAFQTHPPFAYTTLGYQREIMDILLQSVDCTLACMAAAQGKTESVESTGSKIDETVCRIMKLLHDVESHITASQSKEKISSPSLFWAKISDIVCWIVHYNSILFAADAHLLPAPTKKQQKKKSKRKGNKDSVDPQTSNLADMLREKLSQFTAVLMKLQTLIRKAKNLSADGVEWGEHSAPLEDVIKEHLSKQRVSDTVKEDISNSFDKQGEALQKSVQDGISLLKSVKL